MLHSFISAKRKRVDLKQIQIQSNKYTLLIMFSLALDVNGGRTVCCTDELDIGCKDLEPAVE